MIAGAVVVVVVVVGEMVVGLHDVPGWPRHGLLVVGRGVVPWRAGQGLRARHLILSGGRRGGQDQHRRWRLARRYRWFRFSGSRGRRSPKAAWWGGGAIPGHVEVLRVVHPRIKVDGHHADPRVGQNSSHLLRLRRVVEAEIVTPAQT